MRVLLRKARIESLTVVSKMVDDHHNEHKHYRHLFVISKLEWEHSKGYTEVFALSWLASGMTERSFFLAVNTSTTKIKINSKENLIEINTPLWAWFWPPHHLCLLWQMFISSWRIWYQFRANFLQLRKNKWSYLDMAP